MLFRSFTGQITAAGKIPPAKVLVIGAGPVGQMTVRWAHAMGVSELVVADLSRMRLDHAARGGAKA